MSDNKVELRVRDYASSIFGKEIGAYTEREPSVVEVVEWLRSQDWAAVLDALALSDADGKAISDE
jgi:hypothetical protein